MSLIVCYDEHAATKHHITKTCVHRYDYFLMLNAEKKKLLDQMKSTF